MPVLAGVYQDEPLVHGFSLKNDDFVGFNGRLNKTVDTCYAYWVTASLHVRTNHLYPENPDCYVD
jgi:geranylgeranyl transferase type-1 subunit beta